MNTRIKVKNIVFGVIFAFLLIGAVAIAIPMLNNGKICYGAGEGAQGLRAAGTTLSCCPGLSAIADSRCGNSDCSMVTMTEGFVCAKCGDSICGKGENKANCPQDCK
jgi:hypothetical protein